MDVGIVAQKRNARAAFLASDLRERLRRADVTVTLDESTADAVDLSGAPVEAFAACDLIVSIGGDGTFLYAARGADGTPIVGVNLGEVGFLNAVGPDEAVGVVMDSVRAYREDDLQIRDVPRIAASVDGWTSEPAMNEVVVQGGRRGHGGGLGIEVRVDGSLYSGGHADGVLVSTPTGSTAYNLSERGPLVHPGVMGLVVNEMAPEEGMPPVVVPPDVEVEVTVTDADEAVVVSDGRDRKVVRPPTEIWVSTVNSPVRLAGPQSDFFEALNKLD
jgi:NAD+ kinase